MKSSLVRSSSILVARHGCASDCQQSAIYNAWPGWPAIAALNAASVMLVQAGMGLESARTESQLDFDSTGFFQYRYTPM
jgi:hypothetical protein